MDFTLGLDLPQNAALAVGEEKQTNFEVAILGGGPAGMTAAVYSARKQLSTVLISPDLGGQVLTTSGVENYMGFQYINGPELAVKFSEQIQKFPLKLAQGEKAVSMTRNQQGFVIRTDGEREIQCQSVIVATGKRSRTLGIPGEADYQGRGVSYCSVCDGPFFKGKPVVIAGGGNSAITAAMDMLQLGSQVTVVNFQPGWQADEILLAQTRGRASLLDAHAVREILGTQGKVSSVKISPAGGGAEQVIPAEGVFIEIGLIPNTEIFKGFLELNARGEVVADDASHTSQPGVFAAGDCTTVPEKQIIIAAGEGAKAALAAYRYLRHIPEGNMY